MPHDLSSIKKFLSFRHIAISIILAVSVAVYLNTLSNDFVYDDTVQVLQNPWIKDVRHIPEIFLSDVWAFKGEGHSNYYRPMLHVIFMIEYHIFGLKPWGFHLVNIFFHAGVSALVFLIAAMLIKQISIFRREKKPSLPLQGGDKEEGNYSLLFPLIAAILFAAHPIHTEVVAWVSGMTELSFTVFYLLSFYFYIKADGEYGKHFMVSILFFFLSTLCKETALTLPIFLLAYDYSFRNISLSLRENNNSSSLPLRERINVRGIIKRYLPYLIASGIYFITRTYAIRGFAPLKRHAELSNYEYFINIFPLFIQYLEKLILPINLNAFYVLHPISSIFEGKGIISVTITVALFLGIYFLRSIHRLAFFSLLWIVIPLLPVLYIPALGEATFAERYLYLPSVGFVILVSISMRRIYQIKVFGQASGTVIISMLIIVTGLYFTETIKRNYIWRDNYTLWSDIAIKSPDAPQSYNDLGIAYYNKGLLDKAIKHYNIALKLNPNYPDAHYNMGKAYKDKGLLDKAIEHYQIALRLNPAGPEIHNELGSAYQDKGLIDKAIEHYQIALRLNPGYPKAYYNLGNIYSKSGMIDKAIEYYETSIRLNPDYPDTHSNLGNALFYKGMIDKAIEQYQIAIKLKPANHAAYNNMAIAYYNKGLTDKAIEYYLTALELNPDNADSHYNLANAYYNRGMINKAIEHYQTVLRLRADDFQTYENLGDAYYNQGRLDDAIDAYIAVLKLKSDYAEVHYKLGHIYRVKGLKDKAMAEFEITLKLRPDFTSAQQALESLNGEP